MSLLSGRPRSEQGDRRPGLHPGRNPAPDHGQADELQRGSSQRHRLDLRGARAAAAFRAVRDAPRSARHRRARDGASASRPARCCSSEGEVGDSLFVLRSGGVTLVAQAGRRADPASSQVRSGQLVGEMALMGDPVRRETATATVAAEAIEIKRKEFLELTRREDARLDPLQTARQPARHRQRAHAGAARSGLADELPDGARASARRPTCWSSTRRCASAATTARRPAPKRTAASRGSIAKPARRTRTCTFPSPAGIASSRIA